MSTASHELLNLLWISDRTQPDAFLTDLLALPPELLPTPSLWYGKGNLHAMPWPEHLLPWRLAGKQ